MKYLRYFSEFRSRDNVLYRMEIHQEAETAYEPKEVVLSAEAIELDWGEVDKLEPVHASAATVNLISMSDREFADMYTVEVGTIRLDVFRDGILYWCGTLDPELFEEPYSYLDRYVTTLTFSDFAALDRITWQERGLKSIAEIIDICLESMNILYSSVEKRISTTVTADPNGDLLADCYLSCENFFDEDDEPWSMREVLDEILRPFALRIKQKNGRVLISDINGLFSEPPESIQWRAADAQLGVEPTYNKVTLTFSPYSDTTIFDGAFDTDKIIPDTSAMGVGQIIIPMPETEYTGFTLIYGRSYGELTQIQKMFVGGTARLFRISPNEDATEESGVMWGVRYPADIWHGEAPIPLTIPINGDVVIMQSPRIPITRASDDYRLKISVDVLYDPRANPFEEAGKDNEEGNWNKFEDWANYGGIPCELTLYGVDGKIYKCDNRGVFSNTNKGIWYEANPQRKYRLWLEFYDESNLKDGNRTGFGGWKTNKKNIQFFSGTLSKSLTLHIDGEHVFFPPVAGELEMSIYAGIAAYDHADGGAYKSDAVANIARWLLYKDPKIEVVKNSGAEINVEDIVFSAWINKSAEEDLDISTYVGVPTSRIPVARGAVLNASADVITKFTRGGISDSLEKLLIGTIYSNYASRMNTLSGTVRILNKSEVLSDKAMVNGKYLILSEQQRLIEDVSEIKIAEFAADQYEGIEYDA